jgi:hypothetical protein
VLIHFTIYFLTTLLLDLHRFGKVLRCSCDMSRNSFLGMCCTAHENEKSNGCVCVFLQKRLLRFFVFDRFARHGQCNNKSRR